MTETRRGRLDGWGLYLWLLIGLIPVVVPNGPARTAIVDLLIVLGLGAFSVTWLAKRERIHVPFFGPVLAMSVGSILAVVNAVSPAASFVAMAQDAYLYLWFIMVVHLLRRRDLGDIRVTWVWVASAIAVLAIVSLVTEAHLSMIDMVRPTGRRAFGTFYDPNMFASYLVMSLFILISLGDRMGRMLRWGACGLLMLALLATKSNGGMLSLVGGLAVWGVVRGWTRSVSPMGVAAGGLIAVSVVLVGVWLVLGLGVGSSQLESLERESFLARASHSSEGRFKIWGQLQHTYAKTPLGIGPGNSRWTTMSVEARVRKDGLTSKEAHNDYLAYAIERGPLALLGLLAMLAQAFAKLAGAWRRRAEAGARGSSTGPLVAGLAGALTAACIHALTIEVLHYRHFWMLLAIVCSVEGLPQRDQAERSESREVPLGLPDAGVVAA